MGGIGEGEIFEASDLGGDFFTERVGRIEPEELAGGAVEEHDFSLGIEDDQAFVKGFEDFLKEAFFLDESRDDVLDFAGFDLVEARDEFFEESGFHREIVGKCGLDGEWKLSGIGNR